MKQIITILLSLIVITTNAQQLKQLERSPTQYKIPVASEEKIIGSDTSYFQKYMSLEALLDSLQLQIGSIDSLYIKNDTIFLRDGTGYASLEPYLGGGMDSLYNGDRVISRVPTVGTNMGATTFREWLDWHYIGNATNPSLSMSNLSPTLVEVGTSNNYTLSGNLTNTCNYAIGTRLVDGTSWSGSSYSKSVNYSPTTHGNKLYSASAAWTNAGSTCADGGSPSGTATANRSITSVYPVLWGMSATSYTGGSVPYNIFSKRVTTEGNQSSLTMTGTNQYIYILIPKSWSDFNVNTIIDHNGFNVTASFTAYDVDVTSSGLTNNWTRSYKLYKLNSLTTAAGFNYIYNR